MEIKNGFEIEEKYQFSIDYEQIKWVRVEDIKIRILDCLNNDLTKVNPDRLALLFKELKQ